MNQFLFRLTQENILVIVKVRGAKLLKYAFHKYQYYAQFYFSIGLLSDRDQFKIIILSVKCFQLGEMCNAHEITNSVQLCQWVVTACSC